MHVAYYIYTPYVQACQFAVSYVLVQQKFNKSPTSSIPKAARTKHDKHYCRPGHREQVVQGHIKPQQNICSPWKEPKDCKKVQQQTSTSLDKQMKKFTLSLGDLQLQTFIQDVWSIPVCPKLQARSKPNCLRHRSFKDNSGEGQEEGLATAAVPHFNAFHSYARVVMPIIITKHWTS